MKVKFIILAPILIALFSSRAIATCYRINDPDGWTNARDIETSDVIGTLPSGAYIYSTQNQGDYAILSFASSLMVYRYYLTGVQESNCWLAASTVSSSDGYSNVRTGPNGSILTTVDHGETVVRVGVHPDSNDWHKIITGNGVIGYIHYSQIRAVYR
jgi:hypothetical protein